MNDIDASWVAGIIEGEGNFGVSRRSLTRVPTVKITVGMTDEDVIKSLQRLTEVGTVFTDLLPSGKTRWVWSVNKRDDVVRLTEELLPLLHERRSVSAKKLLEAAQECNDRKAWRETHFLCGHDRVEGNLYGKRRTCKICSDLARSRSRMKAKSLN